MSHPPAESPPPGAAWLPGPKPPEEGWSQRKFFSVLAFVLALHLALIFLFATKKPIVPRAPADVPRLQLVDDGNQIIALGDPTLFARPNPHDLVSAFWRQMLPAPQPGFSWSNWAEADPPRYLHLSAGDLGAALHAFLTNSAPAGLSLNLATHPVPLNLPTPPESPLPQATTLQIWGELAGRLLNAISLPVLARNDVIAPSTVRVVANPDGTVFSAVVLKPTADAAADQLAIQLAYKLRFKPAPQLTFGEITFVWHTVPTNGVPDSLP